MTRAAGEASARSPRFPCLRCGRPVRRTDGDPPRIRCPRCRYLIYDYPRPCAGMVVRRGGEVLLLRRGEEPRKGCLDVPGGFVEADESVEAAARRELREETGLAVGPVRALGFYWDRYFLRGFGSIPTMNFYFLADWRRGEPRPGDDAAGAEWVPLARLGGRDGRYAWAHMRALFRDVQRLAGLPRPVRYRGLAFADARPPASAARRRAP